MKPLTLLLTFLLALPLLAETDTARELTHLVEQRDAAAAVALAPVNKRHTEALLQLLARATRAGDLDTAVKARAELEKYGVKVAATGQPSIAGSGTDSAKRAILKAQVKDSVWKFPDDKLVTCHANGMTTASWHDKKGEWKVTGAMTMEMSFTNALNLRPVVFESDYQKATIGGDVKPIVIERMPK